MPIRIYVVEDHPVMRETLVAYLALSPDIELCGTAASAEEAAAGIERANPSLVLLDLSLPDLSGLDLLEVIRARWRIPCLILSGHGERGHVRRGLAAGARGFVLKGKPSELPGAIRRVMAGEVYLSKTFRDRRGYDGFDTGA